MIGRRTGIRKKVASGGPTIIGVAHTFTGADGSALNSNYWGNGQVGGASGGSKNILSNKLRLVTGNTGVYNESAATVARLLNGSGASYTVANVEFEGYFTFPTGDEIYPLVILRDTSTTALGSGTAVDIYIDKAAGALHAEAFVGFSATAIGTSPKTFTTGSEYGIRGQLVGDTLKVRTWLASGAEPGTWDINATQAAIPDAAGHIGLLVRQGNDATSKSFDWNSITFYVPYSS